MCSPPAVSPHPRRRAGVFFLRRHVQSDGHIFLEGSGDELGEASRETAWRPPVDTFELFAGAADVVVHDMPDIFAANGGHRLTRLAENKTVLLAISDVTFYRVFKNRGFHKI